MLIIDDIISKEAQYDLERVMLGHDFNWFYNKHSAYVGNAPSWLGDAPDTFQFVHVFSRFKKINSGFINILGPIATAIPFDKKEFVKIKANLNLMAPNIKNYGAPHIDVFSREMEGGTIDNIKTAIYYVNDATGNTVIFNERCTDPFDLEQAHMFKNLTVKAEVEPKKGRLVVFDCGLIHAGNYPVTNNPRVIINFNFIYK